MTTFASIAPALGTDGVPYASAVLLTGSEVELYNQSPALPPGAPPIPVLYEQAVVAEVQLVIAGGPSLNGGTYVVLQGDLGDGNYYDLAWTTSTSTTNGTYQYLLSAGNGANNAVQQTRAVGTAPGSNGSISCPLPGRLRFVGKSGLTGGSATVTVVYRFLGLR